MASDESGRLAALRRYEILDTQPEEAFDEIVRLAAYICGTPMAAVSLVDDQRQWFKARIGLAPVETPRSESFCTHTLEHPDVLEVPDSHLDPRFRTSPLVTGQIGARFYAASPLRTPDGHAIGTLCVLDRVPRRLDRDQKDALRSLANQTMAQIALRQQLVASERAHASDVSETRRVAEVIRASELRFKTLVENASDLITVSDAAHRITYVSPSVRDVLGYEPDEFLALESVVENSAEWSRIIGELRDGPGSTSGLVEIAVRHRDGSRRYLEVRSTDLLDDPAIGGIVSHYRDITERKVAQQQLELSRAQVVGVLETAHDAYVQIGADGGVTEWNRQAERTFGWAREEALGARVEDLIVPGWYRHLHQSGVADALARVPPPHGTLIDGIELSALRRDGSEFPVEITSWATGAGESLRFSAFLRDITERKAFEERLAHDALHDELTGLPNRNLLRDSLEGALHRASRTGASVAVLFCDLDQFKVINDSLGHAVGDRLLQSVARRLTESTRSGDIVARFGGDEFVVIFDGVADEAEAAALGERILETFREPFRMDGTELFASVSIGLAVGTASDEADNLIRDADAAMYQAKARGRARLELFDRTLRVRAQARHDLEQALRRALERDELRVLYQPVVCLDEGVIVGAEALVRWEHPQRGLIGPAEFIALAEETGLIVPLGAWVFETACRQLEQWKNTVPGRVVTMSVNLSARQLVAPALIDDLSRVIGASGIAPETLTLELTETVLMEDLDSSSPTLQGLKAIGVRIAVDDFGTGYSSLAYLKRFPIDTLKIDKSFVDNLGDDPYDSAILSAITTIGTRLGLRIVAEGVETLDHARLVRAHHCGFAQGYFFSRPVEPDRFRQLLLLDGFSDDLPAPPTG